MFSEFQCVTVADLKFIANQNVNPAIPQDKAGFLSLTNPSYYICITTQHNHQTVWLNVLIKN